MFFWALNLDFRVFFRLKSNFCDKIFSVFFYDLKNIFKSSNQGSILKS